MTIGTGLVLLGVWLSVAASLLAPKVASAGVIIMLVVAILFTLLLS